MAFSQKHITDYLIGNSSLDSSLNENEAIYTFTFQSVNLEVFHGKEIIYQIDSSENRNVILNENSVFQVKTTPGKHRFIIFFDGNYKEIYTSEIPVKTKHNLSVTINVRLVRQLIQPAKPIIYLYPETEMKVKISLEPVGRFTYTYPNYENGWEVLASPNGKMTHKGNKYNYLFWESEQNFTVQDTLFNEGFVIEGSKNQDFLEKQLTDFGFSSEEKADFITYWGPKLAGGETWFVRFVVNEACNQFADLKIKPHATHIYRFYILAKELSSETKDQVIRPKAQKIEPMNREGFVVLEWGGSLFY